MSATNATTTTTTHAAGPMANVTTEFSVPAAGTTVPASAFIASLDAMNTTEQGAHAGKTLTENGAPCYEDTGEAIVTLFFKTVRGASNLSTLFAAAAEEATSPSAMVDLFILAFQTRATRGMGKGEKDLFYELLLLLADKYGMATVSACLPLVSHYGYFKDYLAILARKPPAPIAERCVSLVADALREDEAELALAAKEERTPKLSLAGKWAPRENGKYDKAAGAAKALAAALYGGANGKAALRKYRKLVSSLNAALNTTEVLMAANRWSEIKFGSVASLCLARSRKAFLNEALKGKLMPHEEETGNRSTDPVRIAARKALKEAIASKKGVQGKQLMPHEVVRKFMTSGYGCGSGLSTSESDLLGAQWDSLREGVVEVMAAAAAERAAAVAAASAPMDALSSMADSLKATLPTGKHVDLGKLVPLVDVSGSMGGTPMEVAIALGILVSELTHPTFRDRVLTFESSPSWVDLSSCDSIGDKVRTVQDAPWGGSTDFAAACERILDAAQRAKLTPGEIPDLIVFSDMQFDEAGGMFDHYGGYGGYGGYGRRSQPSSWETHFERLQRRFAEVGEAVCGEPYAAPRIIFWNLRGNTAGCPATADAHNTQLLSGFSPALLKLVMSGADIVSEDEEVVQPDGTVKVVRSGPTPKQTVRKALDDSAFDAVRLKLSELSEGALKDYTFSKAEAAEEEGFELVDISAPSAWSEA